MIAVATSHHNRNFTIRMGQPSGRLARNGFRVLEADLEGVCWWEGDFATVTRFSRGSCPTMAGPRTWRPSSYLVCKRFTGPLLRRGKINRRLKRALCHEAEALFLSVRRMDG